MKTAVSLPDELFYKVEELAFLLDVSRSEVFQKAIDQYIKNYDSEMVLNQLNKVYSTEPSALNEKTHIIQLETLKNNNETW